MAVAIVVVGGNVTVTMPSNSNTEKHYHLDRQPKHLRLQGQSSLWLPLLLRNHVKHYVAPALVFLQSMGGASCNAGKWGLMYCVDIVSKLGGLACLISYVVER